MQEYHKIPSVFKRSENGSKKLLEGVYIDPTVKALKAFGWYFTEKIDGTNIRVHWDGYRVSFGGRTERAQIPVPLMNHLMRTFGGEGVEELFEQKFGQTPVTLYGEGYGKGIQSAGKLYRDDVSFILFDVRIGALWLTRDNVEDIAKTFGIDVVPIVYAGNLEDGVDFVKTRPMSTIGTAPMEGVVGRTWEELRDRRGNRIIVKIKTKDFD